MKDYCKFQEIENEVSHYSDMVLILTLACTGHNTDCDGQVTSSLKYPQQQRNNADLMFLSVALFVSESVLPLSLSFILR
jgi:hypothetical protein